MLNNLKAKVNGNKLDMEFSINRADFVINITYMSNCVYRYGVTGSRQEIGVNTLRALKMSWII